MADFEHSVITDAGTSLVAQALALEHEIVFTRIKSGSGIYSAAEKAYASLKLRTALKNEEQTVGIATKSSSGDQLTLGTNLSNAGLAAGYNFTEIGVYAKDNDDPNATEVLYGIAVTDHPSYMPEEDPDAPTVLTLEYNTVITNNVNYTVVISSHVYATAADLANGLALKQDLLTFDNVPVSGSSNPVKSGGVHSSLLSKSDISNLAPAFSTSAGYKAGMYVNYNGWIYQFNANHPAGAWNAAHVDQVTVAGAYVTAGKASTTSLGAKATAEGNNVTASGDYAHAEGNATVASGDNSHAEGDGTNASGDNAHAEGAAMSADGDNAHAEGDSTNANGDAAHAEGNNTSADGNYSHAEGEDTQALGVASHSEGYGTEAGIDYAHAEGRETEANNEAAHAEGYGTKTNSDYQHVQGMYNEIDGLGSGNFAHIVGNGSDDNNRSNAHTLDWSGNAWFAGSVTTGVNNDYLVNDYNIAPVEKTWTASRAYAIDELLMLDGQLYKATAAIAQGDTLSALNITETTVSEAASVDISGKADLVELAPAFSTGTAYKVGDYVTYSGGLYRFSSAHPAGAWNSSHVTKVAATGQYVTAGKASGTTLGTKATAEGSDNTASGQYSHTEGRYTSSTATCAHSEGYYTESNADYSHASGYYTKATKRYQTVIGKYNSYETFTTAAADGEYAFQIGNGTADNARSNALEVKWSGDAVFAGDIEANGTVTAVRPNDSSYYATLRYDKLSAESDFQIVADGHISIDAASYIYNEAGSSFEVAVNDEGYIKAYYQSYDAKIDLFNGEQEGQLLVYGGLQVTNSDDSCTIALSENSGNNINIKTFTPSEVGVDPGDIDIYAAADDDGPGFHIGTTDMEGRAGDFDIQVTGAVNISTRYNSTTSSNTGGNLEVEGIVTVNGSDYAEKFEELSPCPVGRFVTLDGEKIRLAQPDDDYILGVTSEAPAIVGDMSNEGKPVGLIGKLWVEHDGTANVNDWVCCGKDGIAVGVDYAKEYIARYRVMAVDGNRCKILVK